MSLTSSVLINVQLIHVWLNNGFITSPLYDGIDVCSIIVIYACRYNGHHPRVWLTPYSRMYIEVSHIEYHTSYLRSYDMLF